MTLQAKTNLNQKTSHNQKKIVLVGNPNVGKSVIFNNLTGSYIEVSNFPGTTVDISKGGFDNFIVTDTPGIYGVSSFNDEERVARDVIVDGDIIINVVDALHLGRDLFLTLQLIDMDKDMIICLNMMDEVQSRGLKINTAELEKILGVPVIKTAALKGFGIDNLKSKLLNARKGNKTKYTDGLLKNYSHITNKIPELVMVLEDDLHFLRKYKLSKLNMRDEIYLQRRKYADSIVNSVVNDSSMHVGLSEKLDKWLLSPVFGFIAFMLCMALLFWFVGVLAAQYTVDFTEGVIMNGIYCPFVKSLIGKFIPTNSYIGQILVGEFGILTMVPTYIFGLLLPIVAAFYLSLSLLEDFGYLPRIAFITDKLFSKIGLNGRAVIPMLLGFGCVTAATVSTRLLGTKREKIIATALLGITIPCSAQLGLIISEILPLGAFYTIIYIAVTVVVFGVVGKALDKILCGNSAALMIDIPKLRLPQLGNVVKKTVSKTLNFIIEALSVFSVGATLISAASLSGILNKISELAKPLVVGILRLPQEASAAFVMGIMRRDFGVAGLCDVVLSQNQKLVAMVTMTLFVPCIASVLTIFKERSAFEAITIWLSSFIIAFAVGGALAYLLECIYI